MGLVTFSGIQIPRHHISGNVDAWRNVRFP
jgi:hypothetical protein